MTPDGCVGDDEQVTRQVPGTASSSAVAGAIVLAVVVALVAGDGRPGAAVLAVLTATCAVLRAVRPEPGPAVVGVRSRRVDVVTLAALAVAFTTLALVLPTH